MRSGRSELLLRMGVIRKIPEGVYSGFLRPVIPGHALPWSNDATAAGLSEQSLSEGGVPFARVRTEFRWIGGTALIAGWHGFGRRLRQYRDDRAVWASSIQRLTTD